MLGLQSRPYLQATRAVVQPRGEQRDEATIYLGLAKACGVGLEITGFEDVFIHGLAPEILEKILIQIPEGRLEAPVVKKIPAEIMGQGAGGGSLTGNWHIQTCYPPDIEEYGLEELRYGDLVLLNDQQTDYGKGFYKGAGTLGVISSGPSDIAVAHAIAYEPAPPLAARRKEVPPGVAAVIEKCLAKKPEGRCTTGCDTAGTGCSPDEWWSTRGASVVILP